eukprot:Hpha_TRINITY_DN14791_c1_g2::TRINITY_DN14791_c1_g2_i2::g.103134::m.103134
MTRSSAAAPPPRLNPRARLVGSDRTEGRAASVSSERSDGLGPQAASLLSRITHAQQSKRLDSGVPPPASRQRFQTTDGARKALSSIVGPSHANVYNRSPPPLPWKPPSSNEAARVKDFKAIWHADPSPPRSRAEGAVSEQTTIHEVREVREFAVSSGAEVSRPRKQAEAKWGGEFCTSSQSVSSEVMELREFKVAWRSEPSPPHAREAAVHELRASSMSLASETSQFTEMSQMTECSVSPPRSVSVAGDDGRLAHAAKLGMQLVDEVKQLKGKLTEVEKDAERERRDLVAQNRELARRLHEAETRTMVREEEMHFLVEDQRSEKMKLCLGMARARQNAAYAENRALENLTEARALLPFGELAAEEGLERHGIVLAEADDRIYAGDCCRALPALLTDEAMERKSVAVSWNEGLYGFVVNWELAADYYRALPALLTEESRERKVVAVSWNERLFELVVSWDSCRALPELLVNEGRERKGVAVSWNERLYELVVNFAEPPRRVELRAEEYNAHTNPSRPELTTAEYNRHTTTPRRVELTTTEYSSRHTSNSHRVELRAVEHSAHTHQAEPVPQPWQPEATALEFSAKTLQDAFLKAFPGRRGSSPRPQRPPSPRPSLNMPPSPRPQRRLPSPRPAPRSPHRSAMVGGCCGCAGVGGGCTRCLAAAAAMQREKQQQRRPSIGGAAPAPCRPPSPQQRSPRPLPRQQHDDPSLHRPRAVSPRPFSNVEPVSVRRTVSPRPQPFQPPVCHNDTTPPASVRRAVSPRPQPFQPSSVYDTPRASTDHTSVRRAVSPRPQAYAVYDTPPNPRPSSPRPYIQSRSPRPQVRLLSPRPNPHLERKIAPDVGSIMRRGMRGLSDGGGRSVLHGGGYA